MKKIIFVIMILMAMLSCSQNEDIGKGDVAGVTADELQVIDNKMYRYGDRNPYTGNLITKDSKERIVLVEAVNRGVSEGQVKSYYTSGKLKEKYTVKSILFYQNSCRIHYFKIIIQGVCCCIQTNS